MRRAASGAAIPPWRRFGAVGLVYTYRLISAWIIAGPLVSVVAGSGLLSFPAADSSLFAPGGSSLVELVFAEQPSLTAALWQSFSLFLLFGLLSQIPHGFFLFALGRSGRLSLREALSMSLGALPRLVLLSSLSLVCSCIFGLLARSTYRLLQSPLAARLNEDAADLWSLGLTALWCLPICWVWLLTDLSRAAVVQESLPLSGALRLGLHTLLKYRLKAIRLWLSYIAWSLGALVLGGLLLDLIRVDLNQSWRLSLAWLTHQLVVLSLILLKGTWLYFSLGLVSAALPKAPRDALPPE